MPYTVLDRATAAAAPVTTIGAPLTSTGETLLSFRTELNLQLGNRPDVATARLSFFINQAYVDICSSQTIGMLKRSMPLSTVADQPLYLLPAVVQAIHTVAVVDLTNYPNGGRRLDKTDLESYREQPLLIDEPREFFREGGDLLVLWPTPIAIRVLSVDFRVRPIPLTVDTHSPILPIEWHEAILLLAKAKAYAALVEPAMAAVARAEARDYINTRINVDAIEKEGMYASMRPIRSRRDLHQYVGDNDAI